MAGAASQIDLWDHKPLLEKVHGQPSDFGEPVETFSRWARAMDEIPFKFSPYGETRQTAQ
ncbi:MAG: hypothetical protein R3C56_21245 [Pirellulaceae bacterium]